MRNFEESQKAGRFSINAGTVFLFFVPLAVSGTGQEKTDF